MDLGLAGMRVLVTAGSGGIGASAAERFVAEGARVAIASRSPAEAAARVGAEAIACDLGRAGGPEAAVAGAVERLGGLDVLVNNVGVARIARFDEVEDAEWFESFELNVLSYVRASRAALAALRRSAAPSIVNVSSTAGKRPSPTMPHYSVTKAAVLSLSRLLADTYAGDGIRSNAVCPGPTATAAWLAEGGLADQSAGGGDREEVLRKVGAGRPLGRLATPEEIAAVIAFLASPAAAYVTGAAWSADGGTVPIIV